LLQQRTMTTRQASHQAMRTWRRPLPALLLALACAAAVPGAHAGTAGPVAAELRLRELGQLAERSNPDARAHLLAEAPAFTEGAPYALHVAYLRLLRRIHIDAGRLADSYAVDERIIRPPRARGTPCSWPWPAWGGSTSGSTTTTRPARWPCWKP